MTENGKINGSHDFPAHKLYSQFSCFLTLGTYCLFDSLSSLFILIVPIFYCPIKMPSPPKASWMPLPGSNYIPSSLSLQNYTWNFSLLSNSFPYLCVQLICFTRVRGSEDRGNILLNFVVSSHRRQQSFSGKALIVNISVLGAAYD